MENRLSLFLLISLLAMLNSGCALLGNHKATEATPVNRPIVTGSSSPIGADVMQPVIEPKVERRTIKTPKIDSDNIELGAYGGIINIEDFGSHPVIGARLAYHISESFFVEGSYGQTSAGQSNVETLFNIQLLTESQRKYRNYALSLGWNALPGEVFIGENRTYNTALYFVLGAGATHFGGDKRFTMNGGFGYRLLLNNQLATHLDVRDSLYDTSLLGERKVVNNIETSVGLTFFF